MTRRHPAALVPVALVAMADLLAACSNGSSTSTGTPLTSTTPDITAPASAGPTPAVPGSPPDLVDPRRGHFR